METYRAVSLLLRLINGVLRGGGEEDPRLERASCSISVTSASRVTFTASRNGCTCPRRVIDSSWGPTSGAPRRE